MQAYRVVQVLVLQNLKSVLGCIVDMDQVDTGTVVTVCRRGLGRQTVRLVRPRRRQDCTAVTMLASVSC